MCVFFFFCFVCLVGFCFLNLRSSRVIESCCPNVLQDHLTIFLLTANTYSTLLVTFIVEPNAYSMAIHIA